MTRAEHSCRGDRVMPAKTEREGRSPKRGMIILGLLLIGLIVLYISNSSADYYAKSESYFNEVLLKKMGGP
jgi:hypothetical protein